MRVLSIELRIELLIFAVVFFVIIIKSVNNRKMLLKYCFHWFLAAVIMVIIAVFPEIVYVLIDYLGIETPSNLIFLVALIWLISMNLSLTIIVSKQSEKIKEIIQWVSLNNK